MCCTGLDNSSYMIQITKIGQQEGVGTACWPIFGEIPANQDLSYESRRILPFKPTQRSVMH
jgi:hypothetical protein